MRVAAVLMEILRASGVRHLFGNPGTTELTFLDALPDSGIEYVVALQEATAVAAADGYAQASGRVGVVNVHVAPGVANGLSILHSAARAKTPLVVTAGQQDTRFLMDEPILSGDLVQLTEQFTKWSYEVYPGMDLVDPEIDYVGLARSLGVRAERVEKPGDLGDVLRACIAHPGPALVDVVIDRGFRAMG